MGVGATILKYLFAIANLLVFIHAAFGIIANAALLVESQSDISTLTEGLDQTSPVYRVFLIANIVMYSIMLPIAFIGFYGALSEKRGFLNAYSYLLLICIAFLLFCKFEVVSAKGKLQEELEEKFNEKYNTTEARQNFTDTEELMNCCGATKELKPVFIEENLCPGNLSSQPDCCTVVAEKISKFVLTSAIFLVLLAVIGFSISRSLERIFLNRGSYMAL